MGEVGSAMVEIDIEESDNATEVICYDTGKGCKEKRNSDNLYNLYIKNVKNNFFLIASSQFIRHLSMRF